MLLPMSSKARRRKGAPHPRHRKKATPWERAINLLGIAFVIGLVVFLGVIVFTTERPLSTASSPALPTRTGTPWEYDEETNSYYDPRPGHEHWHPGEPPPEDQR